MKSSFRAFTLSTPLLLLAGAPLIAGDRVQDRPLPAYQSELLDLAFKSACALPVNPHIKRRSRAQESVAEACFELDQPRRALGLVEQIANWRRGAGYARFALYSARHGDTAEVQRYLDLADQISQRAESEGAQDWQRDSIQALIASTYLCLGQDEKAASSGEGLAESEAGKVAAAKARVLCEETLEEEIAALKSVFATGDFDRSRNALGTSTRLFDRFYGDVERRARLERLIKASWAKLPSMIRIETLGDLARSAIEHGNREHALALLQESQAIVDGARWRVEDHVSLVARLAKLRWRAGDEEGARNEAEAALATFDREREEIVDIYRAGAIRPLAEAFQAMGDEATALRIYKRVVEEGVANPNVRPRAEDLTATCCSMAVHGVEPDAELRARMKGICASLYPAQ